LSVDDSDEGGGWIMLENEKGCGSMMIVIREVGVV